MSFWNRIKEASKETKTIVKKSESEIISELIDTQTGKKYRELG